MSECVSECVYMWCVCDYMGVCWSVFYTSLFVYRTQDTERIPVYLTVKTCVDAEKHGTIESTRDILRGREMNYKCFSQVFRYISTERLP